MKNLIVNVDGRFGNHLHQILAGVSIAKDHGLNFYLNSSSGHWRYERVIATPIDTVDINQVPHHHIGILPSEHLPLEFTADYTYLTSYFMNYRWHLHNRGYLRHWLHFHASDIERARSQINQLGMKICAIHVRRDDYLSLDYYPVVDPAYYLKVLDLLKDDGYTYLVCSDDIPWCREFFGKLPGKFHFSQEDFVTDFLMMKMVQCNVVANSSFSYFAAYLNDTPDHRVFYPYKWSYYFGPNADELDTLCPPEWNKVTYAACAT